MSALHHRYATVEGRRIFYREAGPADAPARRAAARLSDQLVHVPRADPTARRPLPRDRAGPPGLRAVRRAGRRGVRLQLRRAHPAHRGLLSGLGIGRYAIYVQDYGAPVGWRLALDDPEAVTAVITQNGNGYEAGFVEEFWKPVWEYGRERDARTEAGIRPALSLDAIRWQYTNGVPDRHRQPRHLVARLTRSSPGQATTRSNSPCSPTTPATSPSTRAPGVLPREPGAAAGRVGPQRPDLRPRGCPRVRRRPPEGRDPPARRRPLPARKPPRRRRGPHSRLPRQNADVMTAGRPGPLAFRPRSSAAPSAAPSAGPP